MTMCASIVPALYVIVIVEAATAGAALTILITTAIAAANYKGSTDNGLDIPDEDIIVLSYLSACVFFHFVTLGFLCVGIHRRESAGISVYLIWRILFTLLTIALCIALCILLPRSGRTNTTEEVVFPRCIPPLVVEAILGIIFIIICIIAITRFNRWKKLHGKIATTRAGYQVHPNHAAAANVASTNYYYSGVNPYAGNGYYYASSTMPHAAHAASTPWVVSGAQYANMVKARQRSAEW